ncbi:NAD(P)H-binding protein [Chelativorans sp. ZYF759]|uniref:NAD-dependent epimerase/dehydratase family protein n=1 Tax=Chelativorans sp. ZYF759 TaxID=2692213 RepID=UPI00145DF3F0|nr:NAD-dependent epimerase/dehydratase family protein [Chelativorans sp. ZYF759]NMG41301.1 NAD(P)H-binding protein [Chelativorans sp. ZYF759]
MSDQKHALILGATGGVGGAVAAALLRHGWRVRGMARQAPAQAGRIEWFLGDAMRREDVLRAAEGVSVIVHAVNPPNYGNWEKLVLPMIDNTIAAARAAGGARVVLPGTVYNFDPKTNPVIGSDTAQRPKSRKGAIRVALEERLEQAAPEVPALILRAGDFFGPGARSSWFSQAMIAPGKPVKRIMNPARGAGHSWAYLPDLAETFALLLDRPERLRPFERLQFEGHYDDNGHRLTDAIRSAAGRDVPVRAFPWWAMRLLSPFNSFMREAAEIAPYWRHPVRLDNTRLVELLEAEPRTPLAEAVRASLHDMGSLETQPVSARHAATA